MNRIEVLQQFPQSARIWLYVANRDLTESETNKVMEQIDRFVAGWNAHEIPLKGTGAVIENRILLLALDESHHPASGCSIDKSVALIRTIEDSLQTDLFNRLLVHAKTTEGLRSFSIGQLKAKLETGDMQHEQLVVNTLAGSLGDFLKKPFVPLHQSWAASRLNLTAISN